MNQITHTFDQQTDDTDAKAVIDKWLAEQAHPKETEQFAVVLHNDKVNSMEYVTQVIMNVFGYNVGKATWLMLKTHFSGQCTLWKGPYPEAEQKRNQIIAHGPDPLTKIQPLTVTLEMIV